MVSQTNLQPRSVWNLNLIFKKHTKPHPSKIVFSNRYQHMIHLVTGARASCRTSRHLSHLETACSLNPTPRGKHSRREQDALAPGNASHARPNSIPASDSRGLKNVEWYNWARFHMLKVRKNSATS